MSAKWSQSTLLKRMEDEFQGLTGKALIDTGTGLPSEAADDLTVAEFATLISRQIVMEAMTGQRSRVSNPVKAYDASTAKLDTDGQQG